MTWRNKKALWAMGLGSVLLGLLWLRLHGPWRNPSAPLPQSDESASAQLNGLSGSCLLYTSTRQQRCTQFPHVTTVLGVVFPPIRISALTLLLARFVTASSSTEFLFRSTAMRVCAPFCPRAMFVGVASPPPPFPSITETLFPPAPLALTMSRCWSPFTSRMARECGPLAGSPATVGWAAGTGKETVDR